MERDQRDWDRSQQELASHTAMPSPWPVSALTIEQGQGRGQIPHNCCSDLVQLLQGLGLQTGHNSAWSTSQGLPLLGSLTTPLLPSTGEGSLCPAKSLTALA